MMSTSGIEPSVPSLADVADAEPAELPSRQVVALERTDRAATGAPITVVVPTYCEVDNIPTLVERLRQVRESSGLLLELLLVDDDSQDGSEELVRSLSLDWVSMVVRREDRGLSQAVIAGLEQSTSPFIVVMGADLSHPPEKIPELIAALEGPADFAMGSRFVAGGSTDDEWGVYRWLNNRVATLIARPLTQLKDPMSGFFALRRETYLQGRERLNPVGYKIGLELLMKCGCRSAVEIPYHFVDRQLGRSKLSLGEKLKFVRHVRRLYNHRFGTWSHFAQFALVGFSGVVVNILLLTLFMQVGLARQLSVALAIALSMVWNFALNRRFSFSFARQESILRQFVGFAGACSFGALVNYYITNLMCHWISSIQLAAGIGVIGGTGFNFLVSRFLVFRTKRDHHDAVGDLRVR
jgi:dolichol-phosphate mannosyltransferase